MTAFVTRELKKTDQLSPNPLVETTTEEFYLGGLEVVYPHRHGYPGGWNSWAGAYYGNSYPYPNNMYPYGGCGGNPYSVPPNFLYQHRLTRDELIDLQAKITAALAITP